MLLSDFDYALPPELIAQDPLVDRAASRLMVVNRTAGTIAHRRFCELPDRLRAGDVLVVNDTRVFPARLLGRRPTGGRAQILLIRRREGELWEALVWPGRKMRRGDRIRFEGPRPFALEAEIVGRGEFGRRTIGLRAEGGTVEEAIDMIGHVPLPPYIRRGDLEADRERYQTVFARARGSVAAPTAGLHFTPALLDDLRGRGVEIVPITLHVGYGTFQPIRTERLEDHHMEWEEYEISPEAARAINCARHEGRHIVAVGTTVTRALESAALAARRGEAAPYPSPGCSTRTGTVQTPPSAAGVPAGQATAGRRGEQAARGGSEAAARGESEAGLVTPGRRSTDLFIMPGFTFRAIDALVTNFHLPRSSLLALVCAFAGRERILEAYRAALEERYRFYSYGDAMLLV